MNKLEYIYHIKDIDWDKLSHLYTIAPLGHKSAESLQIVYKNSIYCCFVYEKDILVGAGRVLGDGLDCAYICDVVVHPDCQRKSIGKTIMNKLIEFSKDHKKIILYSNIGKEGFYKKLGFAKMNTAMAIFQNQDQAIKSGIVSI